MDNSELIEQTYIGKLFLMKKQTFLSFVNVSSNIYENVEQGEVLLCLDKFLNKLKFWTNSGRMLIVHEGTLVSLLNYQCIVEL